MSNNILISIHPQHVEKIMSGEKRYEYRKLVPSNIQYMIVYATAPVKLVVALIEVESIIKESPEELWKITKEYSGISKEFFMNYFRNCDKAYAIKLKSVYKFDYPRPLTYFKDVARAPQSFVYLKENIEELVCKLGIDLPNEKEKRNKMQHRSTNYINNGNNQIVIYQTEDGQTQIDVRLEKDMIWLTREQIAVLFGRDYKTISKHINNALREELADSVVVAKFANTTQHGAIKGKMQTHMIDYFNLEVITSVGYRVKSKRGVQFRQWANRILKEYLVKGYAVNERLRHEQIGELRQLVDVLGRAIQSQPVLQMAESEALFEVVTDYAYALDTLDNYDYERLTIDKTTKDEPFHATYENAMEEIFHLREKFGGSALFGNEKDESFKSSIGQIYQTFGGEELYPSVEEKAAMLLYLVTKNHSFSDGNKRIAATLFLWFLNNNGILYNPDHTKRIADNTLVALTLMIAESRTEEKDVMVKVVVNLINKNN